MRYNNYHKHTHYSNIRTLDSITKPEDYIKRAVELGHTTYFTTEHGYQGNIFEAQTLCEKYGLKCIYGVEAYYVDDINDKSSRTMYHIILIAMTENGRKEINRIMSIANSDGYYYKPRIDLNLLLSLPADDVVVTTACIAGRMFKSTNKKIVGYHKLKERYADDDYTWIHLESEGLTPDDDDIVSPIYEDCNDGQWEEIFLKPVFKHFNNHFFLEVQSHVDKNQAEYNKKIIEIKRKYNIQLIHANDSHYIKSDDSKYRDLFLRAKGIWYEEEGGFTLDYPDSDTIINRYITQGVLTKDEILEALNNTLIFDNAEGIHIDKEFKIPSIPQNILKETICNPKVNLDDADEVLREIIRKAWSIEKGKVKAKKIPEYEKSIYYEMDIIKNCGMAKYFILNHIIVKKAIEAGAVLTKSGRGSAVSFYINKLLGLTEVDRLKSPVTLYPTRFMSAERIIESRSLPDIDLNWANVEPVIKVSKDIIGDDGIYYMVAYKPLQESSAFRLWCKANGYRIEEYDEIAKDLDNYIEDKKWGSVIEDSKIFRGVVESIAPSPCSFLILDKPISEEIGLIKVGDVVCCALDGYNCDVYKYLKDDFLTVKVYEIIDKVYKLIGRPIDDIATLINNCDEKVWDIYANGLTTTINQSDSDFGKQTLKRYKPTSLAEMSAWVAAIRPGFASLLNNFLDRKPYSTGVKELDDILKDSFHYLMYQESIMKYLVWLGIKEKGTYDIIKKIAKKKFTEDELSKLKNQLEQGWLRQVGKTEGFNETWQVVEDAAKYSFNASHSLSVAIDSIYGAYLKSHYPLEYFTVVLTMYSDDMTRTANLINELPYFGIKLESIKFGKSGADYSMDKETNTIYKGIASVKYCNEKIADELMNLSENKYNNFIELLRDIKEKTSLNSKQLTILTGLNFFNDFGYNKYLLDVIEIYDKFAKVKVVSKNKMESLGISEYHMTKYAAKETKSQYRDIDNCGLINELILKVENKPMGIIEQVKFEVEYLQYTTYINPNVSDYYYIVTDFITYKDQTKPSLVLRQVKTGKDVKTRIKQSKIFKENPFGQFSVLKIDGFTIDFKKKIIDGKWQSSDETEEILENYDVIKTV